MGAPADPPIRSGNVRLMEEASEPSVRDDLYEPGRGVWPLRLAKRQRWGSMAAAPALAIVGMVARKIKWPIRRLSAPHLPGSLVFPFRSGRPDLNRGPLVPQTSALTRLRHAPSIVHFIATRD